MPRHDELAKKTGRRGRAIIRLPLAFIAAGLAIAALAEASAQSMKGPNININVAPPRVSPPTINIAPPNVAPPRVNIPPRVHINTAPIAPRLNPSINYGTPVADRIGKRKAAAQADNDDPPPRRRAVKKGAVKKIAKKSPPDGGSPPPRAQQGAAGRGIAGLPPAGERRFISNEVVIEIAGDPSPPSVEALARRHRLNRLESQQVTLLGSTWFRWQIPDGRSVREVVRGLAAEGIVRSVQPNYAFKTSQQLKPDQTVSAPGDPAQYMIGKLRLPQAHGLARGDKVLIAVIDSGIDEAHPELTGVIAGAFDSLDTPEKPHTHGTAIAGAIAAQARLVGVAPRSRLLAVRAFGASSDGAESTTFKILKSLDWSVGQGARVINMSFAGPADPAMQRALAAAHQKGIVLIAAAGNAGPKSAPLYPAADPNVIAVTATDSDDKLFAASNRGRHIAVAAPGVDIFVPKPGGGYDFTSGTSFAAAHVSGVAALILERKPDLTPDDVRKILLATAKDLGPKGRDDQFGAGLTDAFQAITILAPGNFQASGAATAR